MIYSNFYGRLANNLIQNIGLSIIGKKLDLKIDNYKINDDINRFNLDLWQGGRIFKNKESSKEFNDKNLDLLLDDDFKAHSPIIYNGNFQVGSFLFEYNSAIFVVVIFI